MFSMIIMVGVFGVLYLMFLYQEIVDYLLYFVVGFVVWVYFVVVVNEGCFVFIGVVYLIKQICLLLIVYVCWIVWCNFVILLYSLFVVVVLLLVFGYWLIWEFLLVLFVLVILFLYGVWLLVVFGIFCVCFCDILLIIMNLIQVVFFFMFVMWLLEILKDCVWVVEYNLFYYLIEIVCVLLIG